MFIQHQPVLGIEIKHADTLDGQMRHIDGEVVQQCRLAAQHQFLLYFDPGHPARGQCDDL
jgi:hypothetical protein